MPPQKTLYEILGVSRDASVSDIATAYRNLVAILESGEHALSAEDAAVRLKAAKAAHDVLSDEPSRASYDAKLAAAASSGPAIGVPPGGEVVYAVERTRPMQFVRPLMVVLRAIALVILLGIMVTAMRHVGRSSTGATEPVGVAEKRDEEKAVIQEYYQKHGVRPASKEDAEMLEATNKDSLQEQRELERKKAEEDRNYEKFVNDSRREGQWVSDNLRNAEEAARREEEYNRQRAEEEQREAAYREEARMAEQRSRWARELGH